MAQRKIRQLEAAVIDAARDLRATGTSRAGVALLAAVKALDEHLETQLAGPGLVNGMSQGTSVTAAFNPRLKQSGLRYRIVQEILGRMHLSPESKGMCDHELERALKREHQSVSAARCALVERGWLRDSQFKRETTHGEPAIIWTVTDAALAHLRGQS